MCFGDFVCEARVKADVALELERFRIFTSGGSHIRARTERPVKIKHVRSNSANFFG